MIITTTNQKGGVAKTTTTLELGYNLKKAGYSVLLIDLDPQANLSKAVNADNFDFPNGTVLDVLNFAEKSFEMDNIEDMPIYKCNCGIYLLPSPPCKMLASAETGLVSVTGREFKLADALAVLKKKVDFDFILIDTPPSLNVLTINALTASDKIIIPCVPEDFSIKGIIGLDDSVKAVKKYCNRNLQYDGILLTKVLPRTNVHKEYTKEAELYGQQLGIPIYDTKIHVTVKVPEAQAMQMAMADYAPSNFATEQYQDFTREFLKNNGFALTKEAE